MSTPSTQTSTVVSDKISQIAAEVLHVIPPNHYFSPLEEITSDRYLGVILDNKLTFNEHVDAITQKATNLLNLCRRNLYMCPPNIKETAYKSLVRPHLEYASPAWSPHTLRNINRLESVQRRAARFVTNNYVYGPESNLSESISSKLKWLPLQHRRAVYDLNMFYKIRNNLININFPPYILPSPHNPMRYLHNQCLHSESYKYHFFNRTIRLWNILPIVIIDAPTVVSFKSQSTTWIAPRQWQKVNSTWTLL